VAPRGPHPHGGLLVSKSGVKIQIPPCHRTADKGFRTAPLIRLVGQDDGLLSYVHDGPRCVNQKRVQRLFNRMIQTAHLHGPMDPFIHHPTSCERSHTALDITWNHPFPQGVHES
jgi:hypothetical protein